MSHRQRRQHNITGTRRGRNRGALNSDANGGSESHGPGRRLVRRASVWRRVRRRPRVASVWPCGSSRKGGTGIGEPASEWLERAVVQIVTGYTEPGHRVLLIAPPPPRTERPPRWTTTSRRDRLDPYLELLDTNWTIARLGRGVQTTLAAHPDDHPDPVGVSAHVEPSSEDSAAASRPKHNDLVDHQASAGSFDLIVTAADPRDHSWIASRDWPTLLRGPGILAVIAHSHNDGGQLHDPLAHIVLTVRNRGLEWIDHVVLLDRHPDEEGSAPRASDEPWQPTRHLRVHHDLLIFQRRSSIAAQR